MPTDPTIDSYDEQFFDPRLYDVLSAVVGLGLHRVLEVPCSGGSGLELLSRMASTVVGADLDPAMTAHAVARLRECAPPRVGVVVADLARLPFRQAFEFVLVPREALQLVAAVAPLDMILSSLSASLTAGGSLALDLYDVRHPGVSGDRYRPSYIDYVDDAGVGAAADWTGPEGSGTITRRTRIHGLRSQDVFTVVHDYAYATPHGWHSVRREVVMSHVDLAGLRSAASHAGLSVEAELNGYAVDATDGRSGRWLLLLRAS
jgi:hypothetical protein